MVSPHRSILLVSVARAPAIAYARSPSKIGTGDRRMEEQHYAARAKLRELQAQRPRWTHRRMAEEIGYSVGVGAQVAQTPWRSRA